MAAVMVVVSIWGMMSSTALNCSTLMSDSSGLRMCDFMLGHACSHSIPSSSPFSSPSVIYLITGEVGREEKESRWQSAPCCIFFLLLPQVLSPLRLHTQTASLSFPCSNLQFISFSPLSTLSVSACHKSKIWICSALFCNSQLASSIGDML